VRERRIGGLLLVGVVTPFRLAYASSRDEVGYRSWEWNLRISLRNIKYIPLIACKYPDFKDWHFNTLPLAPMFTPFLYSNLAYGSAPPAPLLKHIHSVKLREIVSPFPSHITCFFNFLLHICISNFSRLRFELQGERRTERPSELSENDEYAGACSKPPLIIIIFIYLLFCHLSYIIILFHCFWQI